MDTSAAQPSRVDFYILKGAQPAERLRFACRLAEKAYRLSHRVHLHAGSPGQAAELDDLLWSFRQGSFVPHEVQLDAQAPQSPVTIGSGEHMDPSVDLLVNLADTVPVFAAACARIAEIVDASEDGRRLGRLRFRHYQQLKRETQIHEIGGDS